MGLFRMASVLPYPYPVNNSLQKIGAWYDPTATEFIVWAPERQKVELLLESPQRGIHPMQKDEYGYWRIRFPADQTGASPQPNRSAASPSQPMPGARYFFRLDDAITCPDPASFSQPDGVHGPSALIDRMAFSWQDQAWTGIPPDNQIIYELHTGVFSDSHDFDGVRKRLDYLADLGINAIELMPLAQFPGSRNWGYDGVYPFAIQDSYGGVPGFQRLVNAAHARGIALIVDVVYNHVGPEGNYLPQYGPYFTDKYKTPWGDAVNVDDAGSDGVRNFFLQNARMWLEDYHVDALRLDAVHAIKDFSAIPFVRQLKELAADIERRTGCHKQLIAELDLNDPRYINPPAKGGYGLNAQWIDEFHHALRTLLTGDKTAYYEDFGSIHHLERAFRNTYVYDGVYSQHRQRTFGGHVDNNPYDQFVVFAQNHDQVGNRALGDRLTANLSFEQLKLAAATVLLSPYVPMLFMGEEYGERHPFPFFVSFGDPALIKAVREGRAAEFKGFAAGGVSIPDPESVATFESAVLSWTYDDDPGSALWQFYRSLIAMRKTRPALQGRARDSMIVYPAMDDTLLLERKILDDQVFIWLHFGGQPVRRENSTGHVLGKIFDSADRQWLGPGHADAAGAADILPGQLIDLAPWSALVFEKKQ